MAGDDAALLLGDRGGIRSISASTAPGDMCIPPDIFAIFCGSSTHCTLNLVLWKAEYIKHESTPRQADNNNKYYYDKGFRPIYHHINHVIRAVALYSHHIKPKIRVYITVVIIDRDN